MNIGFQIRYLRLKKKITQKELAQRINVTSGYISQIENNLISPSLKILFSLLKIFNISVSDFFQQVKNIELIHQKKDFKIVHNQDLKNHFYYLFPRVSLSQMEPIMIEIEPQGQTLAEYANIGEIFVWVLKGEISLFLNKFQYFLKQGDSFYLSTDKEYYLANYHTAVAKILKVIAPPSINS